MPVDAFAADNRLQDRDVFDFDRIDGEWIFFQDDKVGKLSGLDGAFDFFVMFLPGGIDRHRPQGLERRNALIGPQHFSRLRNECLC